MEIKVPSLDQLIDNYLLCCITEGQSRKTIDWYTTNLRRFDEFLKREQLSQTVLCIGPAEVRKFILHLQNDVKRRETNPYVNDTEGLSAFSI